ncbi:MAG TPA: hypothetical protein PKC18_19360, partial [Lacipirellulaceae bacterium]|nr:hypothetical protein [Lacipirellulaceae bacterium]
AAQPELAISPAGAIAALVPALLALGPGGDPWAAPEPGFRLVTVSHLAMGAPAFGITPGQGEIWLTLRALLDIDLDDLLARAEGLAAEAAAAGGLGLGPARVAAAASGGEGRRAGLARLIAAEAELLLLDEPTLGVDRRGQQEFIELLVQLRTELRLTIVLVSHDLRAVASLSDRIACLSQTIHYHDVPHQMPADLLMRMFACDLAALGLATANRGKRALCLT